MFAEEHSRQRRQQSDLGLKAANEYNPRQSASSFGFLEEPIRMFRIYEWESKVMDRQLGVTLPCPQL